MATIEETFAKIVGEGKRFHHQVMLGHTLDGGVHNSWNCEHCDDIRAAMMAVLEEYAAPRDSTTFLTPANKEAFRARIAALGAPQQPPEQQER